MRKLINLHNKKRKHIKRKKIVGIFIFRKFNVIYNSNGENKDMWKYLQILS